MNFKIGDRIFVRGYIDEIRKDTVIVRNDGGYFGTVLSEVTGELPSAQSNNQVNLCDSCKYLYPDCPSEADDVIFGNGKGNDNICACNKYLPSVQPEKRTEKRTETHACDLIDREAAVDAIYHHFPSVSRTRARTMLHEVPSAQPERRRGKES